VIFFLYDYDEDRNLTEIALMVSPALPHGGDSFLFREKYFHLISFNFSCQW